MTVSGVNFNGNGQFKFALVDGAGTVLWSNSAIVSGQPGTAVVLPVTNGVYSVFLGDTTLANMAAVPTSVFNGSDVRLRIWFNNGAIGFQQLSPDQRIASVGYAVMAEGVKDGAITSAKIAAGAVTNAAIANGAVGSSQLATGAVGAGNIADGAVTSTKIANGAVTGTQIANGSISTTKLSKQYDSGRVNIYDYDLADFPTSKEITIPFAASFTTAPTVSFGAEGANPNFLASLRPTLKSKTTTNWNLLIDGLTKTDTNICSVSAVQVSSRGVVSQSVTAADMVTLAVGPAVAYVESGRLFYRRALDTAGTKWATATVLDTVDAGTRLDLYVQNGNPAIAYCTGAGTLYFIRATDVNGTAWGARGTAIASGVNSRPVGGISTTLPAIVVYDFVNSRLQFCRATDAAGTVWAATMALTATDGTRAEQWDFTSVNGQPAVVFNDSAAARDSDLYYLRSTTEGVSWPASAVTVVQDPATRHIGKSPRFLLLNGNPAIFYSTEAYYRTMGNQQEHVTAYVSCVRASDLNGATWGTPVQVAQSDGGYNTSYPAGNVMGPGIIGDTPMLITTISRVVPAYSPEWDPNHPWREELLLYRSNDANGSSWGRIANYGEALDKRPSGTLQSLNSTPAWVSSSNNEVAIIKYSAGALTSQELPAPATSAKQSNGALGAITLPSGKPFLTFFDPGEKTLKVSTSADSYGTAWNAPTIIAKDGGGFYLSAYGEGFAHNYGNILYTGPYGSVRLPVTVTSMLSLGNVQGLPAIAYTSGSPQTLYFIKANSYDGLTWGAAVSVLAGANISSSDMQLVIANGNPAIIFRQDNSIKIARATNAAGTAWGAPVTILTDANLQGGFRSAIVGGNPAVAYGSVSGSIYSLKFSRASDTSGTTWPAPVVTQNLTGFIAGSPQYMALAEVGGTPAIALHYTINGKLLYTRSSMATGASGWSTAVELDTAAGSQDGDTGRNMELISDTKLSVLYQTLDGSLAADLRCVVANDATGTTWGAPSTILSTGDVGRYTTASVSGSNIFAVCQDNTRELSVRLKSGDGGQSWQITNQSHAFSAGEHFCATVAGGNPGVFYQYQDALYFIRASDADGTTWPTASLLQGQFGGAPAGGPGAGYFPSATVIGGALCVSFYDADFGNLWFKRAANASGTGWSASVNIVATDDVGGYSSLADVNGRPAVAYYNFTNKTLHFSRASDTTGSAWGTVVTVVGTAGNGEYCQLTSLGGLPAILYYDANGTQLVLVRAIDVNGAAWGTPQVVDDGITTTTPSNGPIISLKADVGRFAKLVMVNGKPSVIYSDSTNKDLLYKRASDATGTAWGGRNILSNSDDTGLFPTMTAVGNTPSVFHFDRARSSVRNIIPTLPFSVGWTAVEQ